MSKTLEQVFIADPIVTNASTDLMYFMRSPYNPGTDAGMTFLDFSAQFPSLPVLVSQGGTGLTSLATFRLLAGGTTSTGVMQQVVDGVAGTLLRSAGAGVLAAYTTTTYPATNAINTIMFASSANVLGVITPANSSILITSAGGVPSWSTTIPAFTTANITFNTTSGIIGTTTNNNATAGSVGEVITSLATGVSISSNVLINLTSITISAGDWLLYGGYLCSPGGGTTTAVSQCAPNTVSATMPDAQLTTISGSRGADTSSAYPIPTSRVSVSSSTIIYLVARTTFAVSTMTMSGSISARRMR